MRLGLAIVTLLGAGLAGCGGGLIPTAPADTTPATPAVTTDASVTPIKAIEIAGTYSIDSITFDADAAKDIQPPVTLTRTLSTVSVTENGVVKPDSQARLDDAYLIIGSSGVFTFYYSIVNQDGKLAKVGPFQSGSISGTLKLEVSSIGFKAGGSNGLADEQETMYDLKRDKTGITLTDVVKETPTPHFSIISATKE